MSSVPVYNGPWTDRSSTGQYLWTTSGVYANIWTNLIAFGLGTFVLGACWSIVSFLFHRCGDTIAPTYKDDGLHRHHRLIWRNVADPWSAVIELLTVGSRWCCTMESGHPLRATPMPRKCIWWRTIRAMLIPITLFGVFTAASILSAKIALTGGNVLIEAHAEGKCGFLHYHNGSFLSFLGAPTNREILLSYQSKVLADTVAGRAYARSCYSRDFGSTVSCSFFVKPRLSYVSHQQTKSSGCPFGRANETFDTGPCNATYNVGAYTMSTPMLDSDYDLGINARLEHRVTFQKNTTCSVINPLPYESPTKGPNTSPYNYTYQAYCLGPLGQNISDAGPCGIGSATFFYNPAEMSLNVGYQTNAVEYLSNSSFNAWQALPEFRRKDGDTTLVSVSANSILYTSQVRDPLFLATSPANAGAGSGLKITYSPYYNLNLVGCVDQYVMCNPRFHSKCTQPSGITNLMHNFETLELNKHQTVTAFRILVMLQNANTYANTYATGDEALKASQKALNDISLKLPHDQWITEVTGWFETGLAKLQASAVEYAANTGHHGGIGSYGFPHVDSGLRKVFEGQCGAQKINSGNNDQNLSLSGIIIVATVGVCLWITGTSFHPAILPFWRKYVRKRFCRSHNQWSREKHERDYVADSKYNLFRMAIEDRDNPYEYRLHEGCSTFVTNPKLPDPQTRATVGGRIVDKAIVYHHTKPTSSQQNPQQQPPPTTNAAPQINPQPTATPQHSQASAQGQQVSPPQMVQSVSRPGQIASLPRPAQSHSQQGLQVPGHTTASSSLAASSHNPSPSGTAAASANTTNAAGAVNVPNVQAASATAPTASPNAHSTNAAGTAPVSNVHGASSTVPAPSAQSTTNRP